MGNAARKIKKVAIFDPYLDTLGGGERYILTIAEYLSYNYQVVVFWDRPISSLVKERLNINLDRVYFIPFKKNVLKRALMLRDYDIFFYITDGSLFLSLARQNILIIQSPAHIPKLMSDRLKLSNWSKILCYSDFVASFIKKDLGVIPIILPPPVDINAFKAKEKENIILSIGRFFSHLHSKKQHILIDVFKKMISTNQLSNWRLILIGSVLDSQAKRYVDSLKRKAAGHPITIITDGSFKAIQEYYGRAKIFWLATGYGENLYKNPEKAEHFGIVSIEAMAAGCVPIVFAAGGQKEIVDHEKNGYLFKTVDQLQSSTLALVTDDRKRQVMAKEAIKKSLMFERTVFLRRIDDIIQAKR